MAICLRLNIQPLPLSELMLSRFVSSLYTQRLSFFYPFLPQLSPVPPNPCWGPRPRSGCDPPVALRGAGSGPSVSSVQSPCSALGHSRHSSSPPGSLVCLSGLQYQLYALGCMLLLVCCFLALRRVHMPIRWSVQLIYALMGVMCWLIVIPAQPSWLFDSTIARRMFLAQGSPYM